MLKNKPDSIGKWTSDPVVLQEQRDWFAYLKDVSRGKFFNYYESSMFWYASNRENLGIYKPKRITYNHYFANKRIYYMIDSLVYWSNVDEKELQRQHNKTGWVILGSRMGKMTLWKKYGLPATPQYACDYSKIYLEENFDLDATIRYHKNAMVSSIDNL